MKQKFDGILVVEGKMDKDLIESFLDCEIVTTNGSDVPHETILYLQEASQNKTVVVLTDPDAPGKRIRDVLDHNIPNLQHAFVPKEKAIKGHKVGVAESDKETILEALKHIVPSSSEKESNLTMNDFFDLGLASGPNSEELRHKIELKFHLGHSNAKTMLNRCRHLGLNRIDLEEALKNG
ncbi:MAG: ribonuclease M5 [Bacilli bacterium]|nr:ribonuclease M5 [Bacilli bacterium]